jgi:transcription initiation factor IIE alpha subunit
MPGQSCNATHQGPFGFRGCVVNKVVCENCGAVLNEADVADQLSKAMAEFRDAFERTTTAMAAAIKDGLNQ